MLRKRLGLVVAGCPKNCHLLTWRTKSLSRCPEKEGGISLPRDKTRKGNAPMKETIPALCDCSDSVEDLRPRLREYLDRLIECCESCPVSYFDLDSTVVAGLRAVGC